MIIIRQATVKDAAAIVEINITTWKSAYKGLIPDDFLANRNVTEKRIMQVAEQIENKEKIHLVAEVNNEIAGFCVGGSARDEHIPYQYELYAIYVSSSNQHQGVGQALISEYHHRLNKQPFYCFALKGNTSAARFYSRFGGVERPEYARTMPLQDFTIDEVCFSFDL